jgi:hypothetical protein
MGMNYQGLLNGHLTAMEVAEAIQTVYGGSNFSIHFTHTPDYKLVTFDENLSEEALAEKPWNRKGMVKTRRMSVFLNGMVACDYADVTTEPMTLVDLGHSGECKKVIDALVEHFGGYIRDEAVGCEFIPYTNSNI